MVCPKKYSGQKMKKCAIFLDYFDRVIYNNNRRLCLLYEEKIIRGTATNIFADASIFAGEYIFIRR